MTLQPTIHVIAEPVDMYEENRLLREQNRLYQERDRILHENDQLRQERDQAIQILREDAPTVTAVAVLDTDVENGDIKRRIRFPRCAKGKEVAQKHLVETMQKVSEAAKKGHSEAQKSLTALSGSSSNKKG
jgi:FtsZ-binding cell division protein ZapB